MDLILADCCCLTDLTVQMDLPYHVIMIDLESRFVYALWLSNLRRIFFTVSTNFHHVKNYHRLSLTCSYRLMTSLISLYGHYNPCQKLMSNSLRSQYSYVWA